MLDFRKVRYFKAAYEEGSLSKAAERENIVQPALSVHLRQLEEEFGLRLFERSPRGLEPTPAGDHFYKLCRDMVRRLGVMRQEMLDFNDEVSGSIAVGLMPSICHGPFPAIMARYAELYPLVNVKIFEAYSGTLADWVEAGELDFAICNKPARRTELKLRHLLSDRFLLVSGRNKALKPGETYRLADIPNLKLVVPAGRHTLRRLMDRLIKSGEIKPERIIEIDGFSAAFRFIEGTDWSLPLQVTAVIDLLNSNRVIINPISAPRLTIDIYEMHPSKRPLSLAAQRFSELVEQELQRIARIKLGRGAAG
ncbi:LysR family transcriptional regulator [Ferrovibrio sp.]|uniref:LysR family transcriptional regulator n=1 Tax=Ferrovibrio sp. TaxID=1917215 RepID=UPI001B45EEB0|nr:LysR family transcriptional regulator [Ferrovibrio sp.]MBP7065790.1 LysR family transcriptional regulator [Ferrovibrio sp.]